MEGKPVFALAAALVLYSAGHTEGLALSDFPDHAAPNTSVEKYLVRVAEVARGAIPRGEMPSGDIPSDDQFAQWMSLHWIEIKDYATELVKQSTLPEWYLLDDVAKAELGVRLGKLLPDYVHPSMAAV